MDGIHYKTISFEGLLGEPVTLLKLLIEHMKYFSYNLIVV